jgi:hypothetical protein
MKTGIARSTPGRAAGVAAWAAALLVMGVWVLTWPWRTGARLLRRRRAVWTWLDARLGDRPAWQRFNARRRLRLVAACDRRQHTLRGTLLPNGQPGKMCPQCGYVQQITPHEFKALFGMNVATAVARMRAEGQRVHNAKRWAATHPRPGAVKVTGTARFGR